MHRVLTVGLLASACTDQSCVSRQSQSPHRRCNHPAPRRWPRAVGAADPRPACRRPRRQLKPVRWCRVQWGALGSSSNPPSIVSRLSLPSRLPARVMSNCSPLSRSPGRYCSFFFMSDASCFGFFRVLPLNCWSPVCWRACVWSCSSCGGFRVLCQQMRSCDVSLWASHLPITRPRAAGRRRARRWSHHNGGICSCACLSGRNRSSSQSGAHRLHRSPPWARSTAK